MESGHIFVITVAAIVSAAFTLSAFAQAFARSRQPKVSSDERPRFDAIEARLSRIEDAMESMALEMERVAEGQRFTAKLLAERAPSGHATPPRAAHANELRPVTPH